MSDGGYRERASLRARQREIDQRAFEDPGRDVGALLPCDWCGGMCVPGTVCPKSLECPSCHAQPGQHCRRPSDHRAARMHAPRWELAERMDRDRERADQPVQIDIFGGEYQLAPQAPAPRATSSYEQPRLFEPQYEGQLAFAGGEDNPEERKYPQ